MEVPRSTLWSPKCLHATIEEGQIARSEPVWKIREKCGLSYFTRTAYFSYRFRTWSAMIRFYEDILKRASSAVGVDLLRGRGRRALDIGCALGITTRWLSSLGYEAMGLDISEALLLAKKSSKLEFVLSDALFPPLRPSSFDLMVAFFVFEHLADPTKFVIIARELLKDEGFLIIAAESRALIRRCYDFLTRERTHINLLRPFEAERIFKKAFNEVFVTNMLLLPIPPHLLNRYFVVYGVPGGSETGYVLVAWDKK